MDPDDSGSDRPFYRRLGFWLGLGSAVPLLVGSLFAFINHHGYEYAAVIQASMPPDRYKERLPGPPTVSVPDEENFCADPFLQSAFEEIRTGRLTALANRISGLNDVVEQLFPVETWPGPTQVCPSRAWGHLELVNRNGVSASELAGREWWLKRSRRLTTKPPMPPQSTLELAALIEAEQGPAWAGLEARLGLPHAQLPDSLAAGAGGPDYANSNFIKDLTILIAARGQLAMENDDPATACRTTGILLRLAWAVSEPESQRESWTHSLSTEASSHAARLVWLAARDRRWTDAEWRQVIAWNPAPDFRQAALESLRMTLGEHSQRARKHLQDPSSRRELLADARLLKWHSNAAGWVPAGWFEAAWAHYEMDLWRWYQAVAAVPPPAWPLDHLGSAAPVSSPVARSLDYSRFSRNYWKSYPLAALRFLRWAKLHVVQATVQTAVALERWRLTHDTYPPSLDALVPELLPAVPLDLDGKPLRYARVSRNERYQLWSVALDLVDDGGSRSSPAAVGAYSSQWLNAASYGGRGAKDWVWEYP